MNALLRLWRGSVLESTRDFACPPKSCVGSHLFTEESDVYSFGIMCYEILIVLRSERPKLPDGIETWVKAMVTRCWHPKPSRRGLTFREIATILTAHLYAW